MFTYAGQLGYMGMNEHGLAHFANALPDPAAVSAAEAPAAGTGVDRVIHYPLKRTCFEQRTVAAALALVQRTKVQGVANMVFCDGDGAIAGAAGGCQRRRLPHGGSRVRRMPSVSVSLSRVSAYFPTFSIISLHMASLSNPTLPALPPAFPFTRARASQLLRVLASCCCFTMCCSGVEILNDRTAEYSDPEHPVSRRLHTNHYVCADTAPLNNGQWIPDSQARLARIRALADESHGRIDVATIKEWLADHGGDAPEGGSM